MNKSPEEYFTEQDFSTEAATRAAPLEKERFTPMERAFMDKYLGMHEGEILNRIGLGAPATGMTPALSAALPDSHPEMSGEPDLDVMMRSAPELLMVGFYLGSQEFTIPTVAVQEVIRSMPIAKLPASPANIAGVINLRGKVTPLLRLREILEVNAPRLDEDKFIIVCRRHGLQLGLLIERVHTMYRVPQEDIDWNVEARIGVNVDFIAGLMKLRGQLVSILSVDRVMAGILR